MTNERDYGDLSGLNKDDARKKWGEEQVHIWRRSYDVQPPGGESLRDTGARVWPYYIHKIQPRVMRGDGVLVSAHGNSLRALIMALDGLTPDEVVKLEVTDNGAGFEVSKSDALENRFGIRGMRERARKTGANLEIQSTPGKGTRVALTLPAPRASA